MKKSVPITVNIPVSLYAKLQRQAMSRRSSVRELIFDSIRKGLLQGQRPRAKRVRFPLIISKGPKVNLTNHKIYEFVSFP
jgi:hypothetical protein